jgi:hypothetical protein
MESGWRLTIVNAFAIFLVLCTITKIILNRYSFQVGLMRIIYYLMVVLKKLVELRLVLGLKVTLYVVRTNVLGEEADLVYIDAFFPNGAGGLGGKVKMLVDVVPVGQKTYLDVGFQKKSNPSEGFPPGSPYGYWARGRSAQDLNVKIEWFKKPGNAARVLFPVNFQGPDIEQENNKDGTSNLKIRYIQELLKDSNYRNELQKFANGYQRFRRGVNTTMEVSEDLVIPALDSSIIERLNK